MSLFKQTAIYGAGSVAAKSVSFLLIPFYTHFFLPADYGTVTLTFLVLSVAHYAFNYGLHLSFIKDFIKAEADSTRRAVFSTAVISNAGTGLGFLALFLVLAPLAGRLVGADPSLAKALRIGIFCLYLDSLTIIPMLTLRALERPALFSAASLAAALVNLAVQVLCVAFYHTGWIGVFYGQLGAALAGVMVCFPLYRRYLRRAWRRDIFLPMLKFGLPYLPVTLAVLLIDTSDRYVLKLFTSLDTVGIYSLGYRLAMIVMLWITAFHYAWSPYFLKLRGDPEGPEQISRKLYQTIVLWAAFWLAFNFFIGPLLTYPVAGRSLVSASYQAGLPLVPLISLAYLAYGVYGGFMVGVYMKEKSTWIVVISLTGVAVNVIGNFILIPFCESRFPQGGMWAAAATTLASYVVMAAWMIGLNQRYYPLKLPRCKYALTALLTLAGFGASAGVPYGDRVWMRVMIFAVYVAVMQAAGILDLRGLRNKIFRPRIS